MENFIARNPGKKVSFHYHHRRQTLQRLNNRKTKEILPSFESLQKSWNADTSKRNMQTSGRTTIRWRAIFTGENSFKV